MPHWRALFERFGEQLRRHSWRDMASQIVSLAEQMSRNGGGKQA
jgi:hypothetical protein